MGIPTIASFSRSRSILVNLAQNQGILEEIYQPGELETLDNSTQLRYTGIIRDLRVKIDVNSLQAGILPNIVAGQSQQERFEAIKDSQWNSPRAELAIYGKKGNSTPLHLFSVSLTNQIPYYITNLLPYLTANAEYLISPDFSLWAKINNAGYGYLNSTDSIILSGSIKEELDVLPSSSGIPTQSQDFSVAIGSNAQLVVPANNQRKFLVLVNTSNYNIYLSLGNASISVGQGIALMKNGGTFTIDYSNLYQGNIYGIVDGPIVTISGNEAW